MSLDESDVPESDLLDVTDPDLTQDTESAPDTEPEEKPDEYDQRVSKPIGQRVSKRINKLVYERNIERQEREKLAEELAENRRLIEELRTQHEADRQAKAQMEQQSHRAKLLARKREALDLGNSDDVIRIDEELFELAVASRTQAKPDQGQSNGAGQPRQQPAAQHRQPEQPAYSEAAMQWLERNPWVNDPRQKSRYESANAAYLDMVENQGYDPDDPETFDALDRKLKRQAPPSMGGGVDRGNLASPDARLSITQADKEKMRQWGLNPDNPVERKAWLDSKINMKNGG